MGGSGERYPMIQTCITCGGSGKEPGPHFHNEKSARCLACHGTGEEVFEEETECPVCGDPNLTGAICGACQDEWTRRAESDAGEREMR
jgi:DnaJ-class molecular chaperone